MNKIKICVLLLLSAILFSCGEDYTKFGSKAYINSDTKSTTFLIKSDSPKYSASFNVGIPRPAERELKFTVEAEESLLSTFKTMFESDAIMLPEEHYDLSEASATIAEKAIRSTNIEIEFTDINLLDRELVYVLPLSISSSDDMDILESARTHYYVFKGGAIINWAADIEANNFPISWGNSSLISGMSEITVESMLYLRQAERDGSDSQIMTLFGVENVFLIRLGDTFEPGQVMVVAKSGGGKYPDNSNDRTKCPVGKWFHLAVTLDSSNSLKIYIDGELKSTSTTGSGTFNLNSNCYIGKSYNDNRWWPGMICETRVWNVARTQEEIADNIYGVMPDAEGLVAYWKFDEGNGNTVTDRTGNGTNITAANPGGLSGLKWVSVSLPED